MRFFSFIKNSITAVIMLAKFYIFLTVVLCLFYIVVPVPVTPLMFIRMYDGLKEGRLVGISKDWVSYDEVSKYALRGAIGAEDGRFLRHDGIDWRAVKSAERYNKAKRGKKLRGASTISMQTARNVFLWQERSYLRKGLEVVYTAMIEEYWTKKRILEVYVNVAEWGDGIYGIEAASQAYFGKPAAQLTRRQASLLIATLPGPRKWNPSRPTPYLNRRSAWIQGRMGVALPKDEEKSS